MKKHNERLYRKFMKLAQSDDHMAGMFIFRHFLFTGVSLEEYFKHKETGK